MEGPKWSYPLDSLQDTGPGRSMTREPLPSHEKWLMIR